MEEKEIIRILKSESAENTSDNFEILTEKEYPLVALRGKVLFPKTLLNFEVGRPFSINAVNVAIANDSNIIIAPQKNAFIETPQKSEILKVGVLAHVKQVVKGQNNSLKVSVQAVKRVKITEFTGEKNYGY